jgi:cardiolipin synthase
MWCLTPPPDAQAVAVDFQLTLLVAALGEILAVIFVLRVLVNGGSPSTTLAWILLILAFPWGGLLLYYMLPRRIQLRRLRRRRHRIAWIESSLDELRLAQTDVSRLPDPIHRLLLRLDPDSVTWGNRVTLLETGAQFFDDLASALAVAQHFVHLQTYILRPDETGRRTLRQLEETARRGVEVRLLYDSIGSWSLKRRHLRAFHLAGGRSAPFIPLLWRRRPFTLNLRNHRKQVIVDGTSAWLGGRNFADEYRRDRLGERHRWIDTMARIDGPAVRRLQRTFVEDWYNATAEDLARNRYFPSPPPAGEETVGVLTSGPDTRETTLHWLLFQLITMAQRTLDISSPYLVPHPSILTALLVAAARGVRVRLFTNSPAVESPIVYRAQRSYYEPLLRAGIELHEPRIDYNHGKVVIVDETQFFIGSPNIDVRSIDLNFEIGVVASGGTVVPAVVDMLDRRLQDSVRVGLADLPQGRLNRVVDGLCRLASPLL